MVITIVADVFGESNNGTTMTVKRLIENLKKRGHEIRIVSPTPSDEPGRYTLQTRNFYVFNDYLASNGVELAKPDEKILEAAFSGADVVHIVLPFKTGKAAIRLAKQMHVPVTTAFHCQAENVTSHVFLKDFKPANDLIYKYFYDTFYKYAHFVHCPSQMIANLLKEHGYDMDLRIISNGIAENFHPIDDAQRPAAWENQFLIGFVGRLSAEKMHATLVEAVRLSKYSDKIQLVFAGDGPKKAAIEKEGHTLSHTPHIAFYRQDELINLLNSLDLYVHPSDVEIEAISCLEALACGCVPVISDSPRSATNHFALDERSIFHAGDPQSLADKIDYWIEHPQERIEMKAKYAAYAEQYRIEKCVDQMEEMFRDAVAYYKTAYSNE